MNDTARQEYIGALIFCRILKTIKVVMIKRVSNDCYEGYETLIFPFGRSVCREYSCNVAQFNRFVDNVL